MNPNSYYRLVLASNSPRRKELLQRAGYHFEVKVPVGISETPDGNLNFGDQILDIARRKAKAAVEQFFLNDDLDQKPVIVIAADTEVVLFGKTLGKPLDREDAYKMLRSLSGTNHQVLTGMCLIETRKHQEILHLETTVVQFKNLTEAMISNYIDSGEPFDKAGGYGIQGLAKAFVDSIDGALDNVIGFPVKSFNVCLKKMENVLESKCD